MYARDILLVGPLGLGLLRSMPAAGAVVMALLLAHRPLERHGQTAQQRLVPGCDRALAGQDGVQPLDLGEADRGDDVGHAVVEAEHLVPIAARQ